MRNPLRSHGLLATLLLLPAPLAAQGSQTPDPDLTFAAGVEAVVVDVVVTDDRGQPVADLTREDFAVSEKGTPQQITSFEAVQLEESFAPVERPAISFNRVDAEDAKRTFVLVFDDLNLTPEGASRARGELQKFLKTIFRPGDLVTLLPTSGGGGWSVRMPEGGDDLLRVLRRSRGRRPVDRSAERISDYEAMMIHVARDPEVMEYVERRLTQSLNVTAGLGLDEIPVATVGVRERAADVYAQARERTVATLRRLDRIVGTLNGQRGRKAVILVSEGFVHDPHLSEFDMVARSSAVANASLYFLDVRIPSGLPSGLGPEMPGPGTVASVEEMVSSDELASQLRDVSSARRFGGYEADGANALAVDSGGFTVRAADLSEGLARIVRESRTYYLLGYEPTDRRKDGGFRSIQVRVSRPGLHVRARKGYYARKDAPAKPPDEKEQAEAVVAGLSSPFESAAIPLRMTTYALGPAGDEQTLVAVAAEADPSAIAFEERRGRHANTLQAFFQVVSREGEEVWRKERRVELDLAPQVRERMARTWIPVAGSFELAPGEYQVTLLLRDDRSGRTGTVRHEFEVPAPGAFRASTPILTDTFMANPAGGDALPSPVPLARRSFAPGVELVCVFDVYGASLAPETDSPDVALRYGVRRADGPPAALHRQPVWKGPDGQLTQRIKIPLRGAPPGRYELVLELVDGVSGASIERTEAFEIVAPAAADAPPSGPGAGAG